MDLLVSSTDERARNAIRHLGEISRVVRVLGCYPADAVMLGENPADEQAAAKPPVRSTSTAFKVGIVGFGPFGQFLAKRWVERGHVVVAYSARTDYSAKAAEMGVQYAKDMQQLASHRPHPKFAPIRGQQLLGGRRSSTHSHHRITPGATALAHLLVPASAWKSSPFTWPTLRCVVPVQRGRVRCELLRLC